MKIQYLENKEIDKVRWDQLIDESPDGRLYAYSWYLDHLSEHWGALVSDDYEIIMPLPWNSKYGIRYVYNPVFIQQLGLYAYKKVPVEIYAEFIKHIPSCIRHLNLSLSIDKKIPLKYVNFKKRRTNYTLNINRPYEQIAEGYSTNVRRILKRGTNTTQLEKSDDIEGIIQNYQQIVGRRIGSDNERYIRLYQVALAAQSQKKIIPLKLIDSNKEVMASYLFFTSHGRAYNIIGTQTQKGKDINGAYLLFDKFFQEYCQTIEIFDFEGSDIPGIAEFFRKWGSKPEFYSNIEINRFPVNIIKKIHS